LTLIILAAVEMVLPLAASPSPAEAEMLRYAAAVLIFTPTMALLGAKRPQNLAWQFVVITLWGVLALPAFELWLRGRGEELVVDVVRSWFLVVMIAVGAVNHLPTRFGLAAVQYAAAQAVLLWPQVPFAGSSAARPPIWLAIGLIFTSALTARRGTGVATPNASVRGDGQPLPSWSIIWREFRDWYGAVWGVRVMERVNASVAMHNWPISLGWKGFLWRDATPQAEGRSQGAAGDPSGDRGAGPIATGLAIEQQAVIEQSLRNLLRRFVSSQWIETRLNAGNSLSHQRTDSGRPDGSSSRN
jgi:hypothetical protein